MLQRLLESSWDVRSQSRSTLTTPGGFSGKGIHSSSISHMHTCAQAHASAANIKISLNANASQNTSWVKIHWVKGLLCWTSFWSRGMDLTGNATNTGPADRKEVKECLGSSQVSPTGQSILHNYLRPWNTYPHTYCLTRENSMWSLLGRSLFLRSQVELCCISASCSLRSFKLEEPLPLIIWVTVLHLMCVSWTESKLRDRFLYSRNSPFTKG